VLTGGARTSLPRQRTLVASVDWSYDLLDDTEQTVLRRLGAFVGGFGLDAAETVCADDHLDAYGVLDVLTRLVDKSLVQLDDTTGRYGLLETVRHYVLDRATALGELSDIRGRHLSWCLDLAACWGLDRRLPTIAVCEEVDAEYANLLAALEWSLGGEASVSLLHPLAAVWAYRSRLTDSVLWSDRLLAHFEQGSPPWVRTVAVVARPRTTVGDPRFNIDVMDQALDAAERLDDRWAQTRILSNNPLYRLLVRPDTDMFAQFDRAIELAAADGDEPGELLAAAVAARSVLVGFHLRRARDYLARLEGRDVDDWLHGHLVVLANMLIANMSGHYADVHRLVHEHIDRFPTVYRAFAAQLLGWAACLTQNPAWLHTARTLLPDEREHRAYTAAATDLRAYDAAFRGDYATAAELVRLTNDVGLVGQPELTRSVGAATVALWCDDLDTARAILDRARAGVVSLGLISAHLEGVLAAADGDVGAEDFAHEALALAASEGMVPAVIGAIETLAAVHPADAVDRALRLAAAATHLREVIGYRLEIPPIRRRLDQLQVDARASLGDDFETAWSEGANLTWEQAVAYAQRMRGERRRPTHGWNSLTPTEHDIVALVAEGLTNPQIAERMFIETSTVKSHVHHIFTKLGIATRSELAATASRRPP
jgi:DNA-binding CsgD family transcriptional regulator